MKKRMKTCRSNVINCVPLREIFHYCIVCDMITPFDGNAHCFICECDSPTGELNDYDVTEEELDKEYRLNYEVIGDIKMLPNNHWIHTVRC